MKKFLAVIAMGVAGLATIAQPAHAAAGDSISFNMARADAATCLSEKARGHVTISDLGEVQNMHMELFNLTPNTEFTAFIIQHATFPFGLGWYQGDIKTDKYGFGVADFTGIFNDETFIVSDPPVQMDHVGIWFADPADSVKFGCPDLVTPFDGDHEAGILVLSTSNFPDDKGPLLRLK